mgnify:CR=1 FL=1
MMKAALCCTTTRAASAPGACATADTTSTTGARNAATPIIHRIETSTSFTDWRAQLIALDAVTENFFGRVGAYTRFSPRAYRFQFST